MAEKKKSEPLYSGADIIGSKRFAESRDILTANFKPNEFYTFSQVDELIETFNKTLA